MFVGTPSRSIPPTVGPCHLSWGPHGPWMSSNVYYHKSQLHGSVMNCIEAPFQCHRKSGGKNRKNHLTCHGWPAALAAPWDLAELSGEHHGKIHLKPPETVSLTPQRSNSGSEVWHSFTMNVLSILLPI